jgi:hypothetical protein
MSQQAYSESSSCSCCLSSVGEEIVTDDAGAILCKFILVVLQEFCVILYTRLVA